MTTIEADTYKAVERMAKRICKFLDKKESKTIDWETRKWEVFLTLLNKKMVDPKHLMDEAEQIITLYKEQTDSQTVKK